MSYDSNLGWLLLTIPLALTILFFVIGYYWIFQKIIIDEKGIRVMLVNKIIQEIAWNDICTITEENFMKNPAIAIMLKNGSKMRLDKRKSIVKVLTHYSQIEVLRNK